MSHGGGRASPRAARRRRTRRLFAQTRARFYNQRRKGGRADTDDRVVPAHSFKYAAALQAADLGARPRLLRVESRAGHGAGKPVDKLIDEYADSYAFAAHFTGLAIAPRPAAAPRSAAGQPAHVMPPLVAGGQ